MAKYHGNNNVNDNIVHGGKTQQRKHLISLKAQLGLVYTYLALLMLRAVLGITEACAGFTFTGCFRKIAGSADCISQ